MHLNLTVPHRRGLNIQRLRALELRAKKLLDRTDDPGELLYVLADPAGHLCCVFIA
jgi:hypothetical protein